MKRKRAAAVILAVLLLAAAGSLFMKYRKARWLGAAEAMPLRESREPLNNPDRGFYWIHGFVLSDELDATAAVEKSFAVETGHTLALLELNLRNYAEGDISEAGLSGLSALFDALRTTGMHFIVRFLYDWDGTNLEREPVHRSVVERHMSQTAPVLNANTDQIYTLQGLFVGNWGEMNGTRYTGTEHWRALARTLAEATDERLFLSVRMPMQWRRICGETEADSAAPGLRRRLGLFNDGMMGSESDLGTYGSAAAAEEYGAAWERGEELLFQESLCSTVPNGGEVVFNGTGCSLEDSLDYLRTLHVSYINEDYDRRVLNAWASETVSGGVWDGMDGLSYIRAHLGYRFTATKAELRYQLFRNCLNVTVLLANTGFAPAYFPLRAQLILYAEGEERYRFPLEGELSALWGGKHTEEQTLSAQLPLDVIVPDDYQLAFCLESERGDIALANEARVPSGAILIGGISAK